jgi:hypothetical protein
MEAFFDTLTDTQLVHLSNLIDLSILKRKQNQQQFCRIFIGNIDTSAGYQAVHDQLVEDMKNIRSRKIYIDEEKRTAKITFKNAQLAKNAKVLLDELYNEVKIY